MTAVLIYQKLGKRVKVMKEEFFKNKDEGFRTYMKTHASSNEGIALFGDNGVIHKGNIPLSRNIHPCI